MVKGIVFFEEYFDYMDDMTPEQYYEFMGLIRDLRFNGVDKDAKDVEDKCVRMAWRAVRPSILKSLTNSKDYEKRKGDKSAKKDEPLPVCYTQPTEEAETTQTMSYSDPVFNDCIKTLQDIRMEKGDYEMTAAANKIEKEYGYSTRDLCYAVRGY